MDVSCRPIRNAAYRSVPSLPPYPGAAEPAHFGAQHFGAMRDDAATMHLTTLSCFTSASFAAATNMSETLLQAALLTQQGLRTGKPLTAVRTDLGPIATDLRQGDGYEEARQPFLALLNGQVIERGSLHRHATQVMTKIFNALSISELKQRYKAYTITMILLAKRDDAGWPTRAVLALESLKALAMRHCDVHASLRDFVRKYRLAKTSYTKSQPLDESLLQRIETEFCPTDERGRERFSSSRIAHLMMTKWSRAMNR